MVLKAAAFDNGNPERGSAILFLFIAIALFGALGYAFLQGTRGNLSLIEKEAAKAEAYQSQDCINSIALAAKRLETRGCGTMVSYKVNGANAHSGAPTDGSCSIFHPKGGAVKTGCASGSGCNLTELVIGESCGGVVYAGVSGGRRIYAAQADSGMMPWNNGTAPATAALPTVSVSDGLANTNALLALSHVEAPFQAAQACRNMGPEWYLPAPDELDLLYDNRNVGDFAGTYSTSVWSTSVYWTSQHKGTVNSYMKVFFNGISQWGNRNNSNYHVRCVRRD